ncbi:GTP-binding protein [Peptacetobacter hiranonis]|uniref:CobW family GTP-binding protein n=1 Tax=Peptacetobacter hiranonis TaxID=89152 RepID=UPI001916CF6E|nr:CobW family GTP-binding protein [Peptacetobacter hiranonis]QQQ86796.1 GTP-binding protein [Peptacetobacter hiranonis]
MKTKLYLLTGFLGSGKTTLLLEMLKRLDNKKIGVIQNEIGKISIDGEILRNDDIQMVELNRGSIFCSCLKLNFVQALADMAEKDFEYLFVESSGIGDPSNLDEILKAVTVIAGDKYEFKGAICLADAINFENQLEEDEAVERQIKHCNMAIITKSDVTGDEGFEKVLNKIKEINPICRVEKSVNGVMDYSFLDEDLVQYKWAEAEESTNSVETKPKTLFLNFEGEIEKEKLTAFLEDMTDDVYRMKGFFNLKGEGWNQVDVVGKKIDYKPCNDKGSSQLVFISKKGPAIIKKIFSSWEDRVGLEMKLKN